MNQRTIADGTLNTLYKNSTSPGFAVELNMSFVDFEFQMLGIWSFCRFKPTEYFDAEIACFGSLLELHKYKHSFVSSL